MISDAEIVDDIRLVAKKLESNQLSRSDYIQHGRFSYYQVYDGGRTWENLCATAGIATKRKEPVPDEVYFQRLRQAVEELGRLPKVSERKKYKLNFSKRRFPTLNSFLQRASELGVIDAFVQGPAESHQPPILIDSSAPEVDLLTPQISEERQVPPIPIRTRRKKWERTGLNSFPYAPQDELGVVAIFAILCSQDKITWDILELSGGKGIDATCFDRVMKREIRVELKYILSKTSWNHKIDEIDYVVCWENRWYDFPKPVIILSELVKSIFLD